MSNLENQLCFYTKNCNETKRPNNKEYRDWIKANENKINIRTEKLTEIMTTVLEQLRKELDRLEGVERFLALAKPAGVKFYFERLIARPALVKDEFDIDEFNPNHTIDDLYKMNDLVGYISSRANLYYTLDIGQDRKIEPWEV